MSEPSRTLELPTASTFTATATTTTVTTVGLGASFVHIERALIKFRSIERFDGSTCCVIGHRHETKATGSAGVTVGDHNHFFNLAVSSKCVTKNLFAGIKIQVSDIDLQSSISKIAIVAAGLMPVLPLSFLLKARDARDAEE